MSFSSAGATGSLAGAGRRLVARRWIGANPSSAWRRRGRCENGGVLAERDLSERLRALRGMDRILPALEDAPSPCFLVGGAVRDLLLDREPVDVDIAVEGDAEDVAQRLAEALGGEVEAHERFGTATVASGGVDSVNLARTRRETYPSPGALPEVEPAGLDDDLGRRDFTINAVALALNGDRAGELSDPHDGRKDLRDGHVRILHPGSFSDDPTRLLRAARYAARLGFELEPDTDRSARTAAAAGALATVSGPRIRDELVDLLAESEAPLAVELLRRLGLDRALHPGLHADPELVAAAKLGAAETGADQALTALATLMASRAAPRRSGADGESARPAEEAAPALDLWLDRLGLASKARDAVLRAASRAPGLADELRRAMRPSQLRKLMDGEPPEALALALALGAPAEPVLDFVSRLRGARLEITGEDLLAAGLPESPALGRALAETLALKLDGEVAGREEELRLAVEIARGRT
jgi:tRNA nucleotidyltransferase (CCA-adding enzyme)